MKINRMTFLGFYLNGALGSGRYDDITIEEVKDAVRNGSIFELLESRLGDDIDLSLLETEDRQELIQFWTGLADGVDESRKMCVDRNGLCLLIAYIFEGIQQKAH